MKILAWISTTVMISVIVASSNFTTSNASETRMGGRNAVAVGGVSMATLPLNSAFTTNYDISNYPSSPFIFPLPQDSNVVASGRVLHGPIPTGKALILTDVTSLNDNGQSSNMPAFTLGVDGALLLVRFGSNVTRAFKPIVIRENQTLRIEFQRGANGSLQQVTLQGYLIDMVDL